MPDNLTDVEENRLLDLSLPTGANAVQCRLTSTAPTDSAAGTEIAVGGYAAQNFTVGAAAAGSKTHAADILFPVATADYPTILGIEIWVGTDRRWYRALAVAEQRAPKTGDQYRIAAGSLTFALA